MRYLLVLNAGRQVFCDESFRGGKGAPNVEIEVGVDAVPVKLIEKIVLPVEHDWVQGPPAVDDWTPYATRCGGGIMMVHPHAVDAQFGQVRRDFLRVLVAGEVGAEAQVHAPNP